MLRPLHYVAAVVLTLLAATGCARDSFSRNYYIDVSREATVAVDSRHITGVWVTPRTPDSHTTLILDPNGEGWVYEAVNERGVPGVSEQIPFRHAARQDRLELLFEDGHVETLAINWLKTHGMSATIEGTSTWVKSATWTRLKP